MNLRPALPIDPAARKTLLRQLALAVATAALLLLAFPPFEYDFLAWVALAPLLLALAEGASPRRAFLLGWLVGLVFTFGAEHWIAHSMTHFGGMLTIVAYAVALVFASVLAVFPGLFAWVMTRLVGRFGWSAVAFAPLVWVATEYVRPLVTGVTWNALGVSQYAVLPVARLARWGGVALLSAELVAASAVIVLLLKAREAGPRRAAAMLMMGALAFFFLPTEQTQAGLTVTAIGVQPNLPPDAPPTPESTTRDLENNIRLAKTAIAQTPNQAADLIIWAESPLALFYENDPATRDRLQTFAAETRAYLIANTVTRDGERYFNSISTISPRPDEAADALQRYDKIRLVPFGEYVPFNAVLKHLVPRVISSDTGGFAAGRTAVVNRLRLREQLAATSVEGEAALERTTNFLRVGGFICYESAYPNLVRQFVRNGAGLLVNVSNDAWFGNTAGARQHVAHVAMRAIENDRDIVRATNSGISALVTSDGQIVNALPSFTAGATAWQATARRGTTFYTRHGDWFGLGCAVLSVALLAAGLSKPAGASKRVDF